MWGLDLSITGEKILLEENLGPTRAAFLVEFWLLYFLSAPQFSEGVNPKLDHLIFKVLHLTSNTDEL